MPRPAPLAVLALLLLSPSPAAAPLPAPREGTVLLFHTNDLHGHIEGAAALAGLVAAERARRRDVLWLDAGDAITGTPVSTVFKGTPVFTVTSAMGIDAGCLGNHEFDHGWERIALFREEASYPLLCANARAPGPDGALLGDAEWTVREVGGVRVGVIGVVTEDTPRRAVRKGNEGVRFEPARKALLRLVPAVRERCDLLVALTHCGYEADLRLAEDVPGIDVIVGGHSHTALPGPVRVGRTLVAQAGSGGRDLGRLDLVVDLDRGAVARWEGRTLPVDPSAPPQHAAVAALVRALEARVEARVRAVVGRAARDLGRGDLLALAERALRETAGADVGYVNARGVRDVIPAGPVTIRRVWTAFPFDDTIVVARVRGGALPDRARDQLGAPPDRGRLYSVATNSYVGDHLREEIPGAEPGVEDSGVLVRDAVVEWIRRHPELR